MRPLLVVIGCLFLAACEKRPTSFLSGTPMASNIYLMMGQSNLANMPPQYISEPLSWLVPTNINVIQCARGGSALSEWQKGEPLYEAALAAYRSKMDSGKLAGIFFWQGEKEGVHGSDEEARTWARRFARFVFDFRADVGDPNLRVVFMQIGILDSYPYARVVREQQASISIPNVVMTTTAGYSPDADGHHFGTHSKELGERMAAAMANASN